jgi:hypothetical protein
MGGTLLWRSGKWVGAISGKLGSLETKIDDYAEALNGEVDALTRLHRECFTERTKVETQHGQRLSKLEGRLEGE